ncbi:hypothetical protein [Caulobacter vibrioides]|uniref:hypothetical protein n=1 Tax=Caulobacter vibrioides TaxID=155892 RepID=UPI001E4CAA5F|nr:hypothetical protein [Caulobacter vibrioides]
MTRTRWVRPCCARSHSVSSRLLITNAGDCFAADSGPGSGPGRPARTARRPGRWRRGPHAPRAGRPRSLRAWAGAGGPCGHDRPSPEPVAATALAAPVRRAGVARLCASGGVLRPLGGGPGDGAEPARTARRGRAGPDPARGRRRPASRAGADAGPVPRRGSGDRRDPGQGRLVVGTGGDRRAALGSRRQPVPRFGPRCLGAACGVGRPGAARRSGVAPDRP